MREAKPVKRNVELADITVDPGVSAPVADGRALVDHGRKVTIDGDGKGLPPDSSRKPSRDVEFVPRTLTPGKRDQGPHVGVIEFDLATVSAVRHRENAKRIGLDQCFRRECECLRHPVSRTPPADR